MKDEKYYQQVIDELRAHGPNEALWLKALTLNNGDEQKAKIQYVKWRVAQLVEEERAAAAAMPPPYKLAEPHYRRFVVIVVSILVFLGIVILLLGK
jgi:hypothetical protein